MGPIKPFQAQPLQGQLLGQFMDCPAVQSRSQWDGSYTYEGPEGKLYISAAAEIAVRWLNLLQGPGCHMPVLPAVLVCSMQLPGLSHLGLSQVSTLKDQIRGWKQCLVQHCCRVVPC